MAPEGQVPDAAVLSPRRSPGSHAAPQGAGGEGQALAVTGGHLGFLLAKRKKTLNLVLSGAWSPVVGSSVCRPIHVAHP